MTTFVVTIDTEEEGLWGAERSRRCATRNVAHLPELADLAAQCGVALTLLVAYSCVVDNDARRVLETLARRDNVEIGAHLHAWSTPPFDEPMDEESGFPENLPADLLEAKMTTLVDAVADAFGEAPTSYRGGRFSFGPKTLAVLEKLSFATDTSATPLRYEKSRFGTDWSRASGDPYFPSRRDVTRRGDAAILEVPCTLGFDRAVPGPLARFLTAGDNAWRKLRRAKKYLRTRFVWLRPSTAGADEMQALARRRIKAEAPVLNMMFHSSELLVGGSPYVKTDQERREFLDRIEQTWKYITRSSGVPSVTLREFDRTFRGASSRSFCERCES